MTMDVNYARLSLLAGMFAYAADTALGRPHFIDLIRANAWNLTWESLATWKAQAIAMGVPPKRLELSPEFEKLLPVLVETGIALQTMVDERTSST